MKYLLQKSHLTFDPSDEIFKYITVIPDGAFYGCEKLKGITFENITSIGREAFASCLSLGVAFHIYLPSTVTYVGHEAFAYTSPSSAIDVELDSTTIHNTLDINWNKNYYGELHYEVAA